MRVNGNLSKSSLPIIADAVISAVPAVITAITLRSGTTASSLVLYDNASAAAGNIIWAVSLIATTAAGDQTHSISFPSGLVCSNGIYADWTGTGALGYVAYEI